MAESMAGPSKKAKFKIYRGSESLFDHFSRLGTSQSASVSVVSNESSVSAVVLDDTLLEGSFEVAGNPGSLDDHFDEAVGISEVVVGHQAPLRLPMVGPRDTPDCGLLKLRIHDGSATDEEKYRIVSHLYQPENVVFPASQEGKQMRSFQSSWFLKYPWLTYSRMENDGYCAYCFVFAFDNSSLGVLVRSPMVRFKKALETLQLHDIAQYHRDASVKAVALIDVMEGKHVSIANSLNETYSIQVQRNRKVLKSIMDTVQFCGQQGIALRGHRDDSMHLDDQCNNPGNFQALLQFRCNAGDNDLSLHFKECARNSTYRSKTIQNDILNVFGDMIKETIIAEVKAGKHYAIIADEVQDAASIEQISVVLRYVHKLKDDCRYTIKECFVAFKELHRIMTGAAIAESLLDELRELGLNLDHLRGQGYDGSGAMAGSVQGASSIILQRHPLASSCSDVLVRNMMGSVSEVHKFFEHGKRQDKLTEVIEATMPDTKKVKIKSLCRTRWIERHNALEVFVDLYPAIIQSLRDISMMEDSVKWNRETIQSATGLLGCIEKFSFVISLVVVFNTLCYIKGLTVLLQRLESLDIVKGIQMVAEVKELLNDVKENIVERYQIWHEQAVRLVQQSDCEEPSIPRRCKTQTLRSNVEADVPEVYYRRTLAIPFLDHLLNELGERFTSHANIAALGLCLVPKVLIEKNDWNIHVQSFAKMYESDLPAPLLLDAELHAWKMKFCKWKPEDLPTTPLAALNQCDNRAYPNTFTLLQLLCTIPVTSCM